MITQEQAEAELTPYMGRLRRCIESGWDNWEEMGHRTPGLRVSLTPRSRANMISDWVCNSVRREFERTRNVRVHEVRGFPELVIKGTYVIRFKKLDRNGRSRNILTRQQRAWFNGQLSLPGTSSEDASRLVAGYILDLLGTEMERVLVTCPVGASSIAWAINLSSSESNIVELPRSRKSPTPPPVRSRKKKISEQDDDDGGA